MTPEESHEVAALHRKVADLMAVCLACPCLAGRGPAEPDVPDAEGEA